MIDEKYIVDKLCENYRDEELPAARYILNKWPSKNFWKFFKPEFKVKSLWWFKSAKGRNLLDKHYKMFKVKTPETKEVRLKKKKIGETIKVDSSPKTLMDFLNGKKKK